MGNWDLSILFDSNNSVWQSEINTKHSMLDTYTGRKLDVSMDLLMILVTRY